MCGRFDTSSLTWAEIHAQLSGFAPVRGDASNMLSPSKEVFPSQPMLTARMEGGAWSVEPMRWGLIPSSYKGRVKPSARGAKDGFQLTTINCRVEQPEKSYTFKWSFKERRCLVPASAWFEWQPGSKIKHRFAHVDDSPIWLAAIWDRATTADLGDIVSAALMTGPSEGKLSDYHDRAPVILDREDWAAWLDSAADVDSLKALMARVRPERFEIAPAT